MRRLAGLRACLTIAVETTPLIKHAVVNAMYGPEGGRPYQLSEAIRHTRSLLDELESQQTVLGWREREDAA